MPDEYETREIADDDHMDFRRCRSCGCEEMRAETTFRSTGLTASTDNGLNYECPQCGAQVRIRNGASIFLGAVISLFWGAVGIWAFWSGPLWYIQHFSYHSEGYGFPLLLIDIVFFLLGLGVFALGMWTVWSFFVAPMLVFLRHPVVGQNRSLTTSEITTRTRARRDMLLSLLAYPMVLWAFLIGILWTLDAVGLNAADNAAVKTALVGGLLGGVYLLARRIGVNAFFMFVGMVIWLVVFVAVVFTLG